MTTLNIFESIWKTTRRIEPFHSQFLGDALRASLKGDRSLFDGIWSLCAPADWNPPQNAKVKNEFKLGGGQRIDILIKDREKGRRVGIEVKTSRASARAGQLEDYLQGLRKKYDDEKIAIAYLTPFNRSRAEAIIKEINHQCAEPVIRGDADALSTVKVFEEFRGSFGRAEHVSWIDIARIDWNGGEIWSQHQSYVLNTIASPDRLRGALARDRPFEKFFSKESVEKFWDKLDALPQKGVERVNGGRLIDLKTFEGRPNELAGALTILIEDDDNVASRKKVGGAGFPTSDAKSFANWNTAASSMKLFSICPAVTITSGCRGSAIMDCGSHTRITQAA